MKKNLQTKGMLIAALLFLVSLSSVNAQRKLRDYLVSAPCMLVSGMLDGTIESISYHYDRGFKPRFPKANDKFWNPELSWKNKYKNGDCQLGPKFAGSTSILVCTTDAYHMLRTANRAVNTFALTYYINKSCKAQKYSPKSKSRRFRNMATDFMVLTAMRCAGFSLTYNVLFKVQKNPLRG